MRAQRWFAYLFAAFAMLWSFFMLRLVSDPVTIQDPIVEWIRTDYRHVTGCPGDTNRYTIEMKVNKPAILFVAVSQLRGEPLNDTAKGSLLGDLFVTVIPTARELVDHDAVWTIPDLPPGDYERVVGAGTLSEPSIPAIRIQTFTIRGDCEEQ